MSERTPSRAASPQQGRPTELEAAVLGIVARRGPCTAYAVRKSFLDAPSTYWSGSAGAIYPLVARLEKRGLLAARERPWGRGTKKLLSLTAAGRRTLRRWLAPPLPVWVAAHTVDPVRTRLFYLDSLPAAERLRFVDDAESKTRLYLAHVRGERQRLVREGNEFERLAARGIELELEARLAWLQEVRGAVVRTAGDDEGESPHH
jgi:DNA-binding PadR family transcriptional regulator